MNLIRVTDEGDGELLNRGYSYHSQAHVDGDRALAFAGHADGLARFFQIDLRGGDVQRLGALIPDHPGTGEGWFFDRDGRVCLTAGPQLVSVDPWTRSERVLMALSDHSRRLWQAHSSDDGTVHSATVERITENGPYIKEGTLVQAGEQSLYFPARGVLDESQVTADGAHLIIKERFFEGETKSDDNLIVTLATGQERTIRDADGALGHSDVGAGYAIGEADRPEPGQCIYLDLTQPALSWRVLFNTRGMGHVSVQAGRCVQADDTALWLVDLDGAGRSHLVDHGMPATDYDHQCHANLSPCGRVVAYVSNVAGRFDLYLGVL